MKEIITEMLEVCTRQIFSSTIRIKPEAKDEFILGR